MNDRHTVDSINSDQLDELYDDLARARQELADRAAADSADAAAGSYAGRIDVYRCCPHCGDWPLIVTRLYAEHVATVHPEVREGGPGTPEPEGAPPADESARTTAKNPASA